MKFHSLSFGLFSLAMVAAGLNAAPAEATCIAVDVSTQVAIHGSQEGVDQQNNPQFAAAPYCSGSVTVDTGSQVYVGAGEGLSQERTSEHFLGESEEPAYPVEGPTIFIPVETQTDVYAPPFDPTFQDQYYYGDYYGDALGDNFYSHNF